MNKENFKQLVQGKVPLQEGEFEKLWEEKIKEAGDFGTPEEEKEKFAINNLFSYFKRYLNTKADKFEGIILGASDATNFGATKIFNAAIELWDKSNEEIRKAMIEKGEFDNIGNPLWCEMNSKTTFKYKDKEGNLLAINKRKINPERETRRLCVLLAKKDGDTEFSDTRLTLNGDRALLSIPIGKRISFQANGKKNEEGIYNLYSVGITNFVVLNEEVVPHNEFLEIIEKYFTQNIFDLNITKPEDWLRENANKKLVFIKNAHINSVSPVRFSKSLSFDEDAKEIKCWNPRDFELNIAEGHSEVVAIGELSLNNEGELLLNNCMGFFNPNKMIKPLPVETVSSNVASNEEVKEW